MEEFNSTKDYFSKVSSQVSAHSIAGPGIIARCVKTSDRAWHARYFNGSHLGLEIVQCFLGDVLDQSALDAAAWECANWSKEYSIPVVHDINHGFAEHWEVPPGREDKKSDIESPFDIDDFLRRVVYYKGLLL